MPSSKEKEVREDSLDMHETDATVRKLRYRYLTKTSTCTFGNIVVRFSLVTTLHEYYSACKQYL